MERHIAEDALVFMVKKLMTSYLKENLKENLNSTINFLKIKMKYLPKH